MPAPFFRFGLKVGCDLPSRHSRQAGTGETGDVDVVGYPCDPMIRSCFPEPVRGRFGIVSKALFAFTKRQLCKLAVLDVGRRAIPARDTSRLIAQRLRLEQKPAIYPIEAPQPGFQTTSFSGFPDGGPLYIDVLLVFGMKGARPIQLDLPRS